MTKREIIDSRFESLGGEDSEPDVLAAMLDNAPGLFYLIDRNLRFRRWNSAFEKFSEYGPAEIEAMSPLELVEPEFHDQVMAAMNEVFEDGQTTLEAPLTAKSGRVRHYSYVGRRVTIAGEVMIAGSGVDITKLKNTQREYARQAKQLNHLAANVPGVIYQLRLDQESGRISMPFASAKLFDVLGVHHSDVAENAQSLLEKIVERDQERIQWAIDVSAQQMTPFREQFRILGHNADREQAEWVEVEASPERQDDGSIVWHGFARLVTARHRMEDELNRLAYNDPLTGLPNRLYLGLILEERITEASLSGHGLALLHLNLDNFKEINDIWGHSAGDRLLLALSKRLTEIVGKRGRIGRLGGDEFLILLQGKRARKTACELAQSLCKAMDTPLASPGHEVRVTSSVGISLFPDDGQNAEDLLRHADAALHQAKDQGPSSWALYSPELTAAVMARRYLETELRAAVEREEIQVALQPIVDLHTRKPVGYEALARWHHRSDGWIDPEQFIELAEQRGLVAQLGEQVYAQAMQAMVKEERPGVLAINVAPMQLRDPQFAHRLVQIAKDSGFSPTRIEVEITERAFMQNPDKHPSQLQALRDQDIRVVIDDFGTGYSSLAYLGELPIQGLKIDRIFVKDVDANTKNAAIIKAMVTLADALGISVVAEGIQTDAELATLRALGCVLGQGWYYGRADLITETTQLAKT